MKKGKVGAPTKFTPEVKKRLIIALRKGAPYEHACKYARISYEIFRQWRLKADKNIPEFVAYFEDIKEAEAETSLIWLDKIDKAMTEGAWQAAAWKLERRYPEIYGREAPLIKKADELTKLLKSKESKEDAKALDSRRYQETRCITQRIESANGEEDTQS